MYQARDVMTTEIITVRPEATIEQAMRALVDHHVSGMPVVDSAERLLGIISEYQLLEVIEDLQLKSCCVRDFMTCEVITATPDTLLSVLASQFFAYRIRRIPVLDQGRLVGVVSRRDILQYILDSGLPLDEFVNNLWSSAEVPSIVTEANPAAFGSELAAITAL